MPCSSSREGENDQPTSAFTAGHVLPASQTIPSSDLSNSSVLSIRVPFHDSSVVRLPGDLAHAARNINRHRCMSRLDSPSAGSRRHLHVFIFAPQNSIPSPKRTRSMFVDSWFPLPNIRYIVNRCRCSSDSCRTDRQVVADQPRRRAPVWIATLCGSTALALLVWIAANLDQPSAKLASHCLWTTPTTVHNAPRLVLDFDIVFDYDLALQLVIRPTLPKVLDPTANANRHRRYQHLQVSSAATMASAACLPRGLN